MALPSFIKDATSLDDGIANKMASGLAKLNIAKSSMEDQLSGVGDIIATVDGESLPDLPLLTDISDKSSVIESGVMDKIDGLDQIDDLVGSCLGGAVGAAYSISKNSFGFIEDSLDLFSDVTNMPSQMFDIFKLYGIAQQFIASLGIDELISDMNSRLGCLSDSSMISDIQGEISNLTTDMGLDSSGVSDADIYYNKMKTELGGYALANDIDTSWTDSMAIGLGSMTEKTDELSSIAKTATNNKLSLMKENIKSSISKTTVPTNLF